ncbi:MAG: NRDE family protein [Halobacteriales archaeon]
MCTIVLAWRVFEETPVAIAANRDEGVDRPASPPEVVDADPRVVAPRDEEAGGTWIGYNEAGVLAAITNRWTDREREGERSRGLLVRDALAERSAEDAACAVERELDARAYDCFNLVLCDAETAIVLEWDGRLRVSNLAPGVHTVMNVGHDGDFEVPERRREPGERQIESARLLGRDLAPTPGEVADPWLDRAGEALGDHDYGVCVHADGFGTRSSSLIALDADGRGTYRYADGPPCRTPYGTVEADI